MRAAQIAVIGDKKVEIRQPPQVSCFGPAPILRGCTRPIAYKIDGSKLFKISECLVNRRSWKFVALAQAAGNLTHRMTTITLAQDFCAGAIRADPVRLFSIDSSTMSS